MGKSEEKPKAQGTVLERIDDISEGRKCRDIPFLLLFLLMWAGMVVVAAFAISEGDPLRILLPMDYLGNFCGRNNIENPISDTIPQEEFRQDFTDDKVLYFITPFNLTYNKCMASCPGEDPDELAPAVDPLCASAELIPDFSLYGADDSDAPWSFEANKDNPNCACSYDIDELDDKVCFQKVNATSIARRCVPDLPDSVIELIEEETAGAQEAVSDALADVQEGYGYLLATGGIAVVLGFVWLLLSYFLSGIIVWLTIAACLAISTMLAAWLYFEADDRVTAAEALQPEDEDATSDAQMWQITSYVVIGLVVAMYLVVIFMFKRIQIAIGVVKYGARALGSNPFLLAVPLVSFLVVALVFFYSIVIGMYLYSAGDIELVDGRRTFVLNDDLKNAIIYHLFGTIWTILFIMAICSTTVSGTVAQHYFTQQNTSARSLFPVWSSFIRTIRYSLGSLAFGSMLVAIVVTIRIVFEYMRRQMAKENSPLKYIACIISCCLNCFQRFLEFITSNAYVQIAIKGSSFCRAAKDGWSLMTSNILRASAVTIVATFIGFLGKLFVCGLAVWIGWVLMTNDGYTSFILCFCMFFIAYVIALLFVEIFEQSVKATLHSFLLDEQVNLPNPVAPKDLAKHMTGIKKAKKKAAKAAEKANKE